MTNINITTNTNRAAADHNEYEAEKTALMPELIRYFNGDIEEAEKVAEEMAWGLVYA